MVGFAQTTIYPGFNPLDFDYQRGLFIYPHSPYKPLYKDLHSRGISLTTIQNIEQARLYVESFWSKLIVRPEDFSEKDKRSGAIKLPAPFIMPMPKGGLHARFFYWDSYFTSLPHIGTEKEYLVLGAIENCAYLLEEYQVIPNQADIRFLHRSQPPILTSLIMDVYRSFEKTHRKGRKAWLKKNIDIAKKEYYMVWTSSCIDPDDEKANYNHRKYNFTILSNWGDRDIASHHPAEYESGKDTTAEFAGRAADFLPVDLNCFLLRYERDFAEASRILQDTAEEKYWIERTEQRIDEMNTYMWDEKTGYFYNYDVVLQKRDIYKTLSGFQTLWAGLATKKQAKRMVNNLTYFETKHGLMTTSPESSPPAFEELHIEKLREAGIPERYLHTIKHILLPGQWSAPNIWSPTQLMTVMGLLRYGYKKEAKRIMENSLISLANYFHLFGSMPEKRNGYTGNGGGDHTYPDKTGFGWTNAEFSVYLEILQKMLLSI